MVTRWLITGGLGFIGRNLILSLIAEGDNFIRVVDNLSVGSRDGLAGICDFNEINMEELDNPIVEKKQVELVIGDVVDADLARRICTNFDVIVHLAANTGVAPSVENPRMDCEVNIFGTLNYLEAARFNNVKRFIFASSSAPVGEVEKPINEEMVPRPTSPYGASKLAGEGYCSVYYKTYGVETVCLRFSNVYGPLSSKKSSVIAKFIKRALAGKALEIYGAGDQARDFICVLDLVNAIRISAEKSGIGGEIFQIGTGKETSIESICDMLTDIFSKFNIEKIGIKHTGSRRGDVKRSVSDAKKASDILGWQCEFDLKGGLYNTVKWFIDGRV